MTQSPERTTTAISIPTPVRRRASQAVPVLIQIPNLATSRSPKGRVRRRRLRREVRVAGFLLLALFPLSLAIGSLGGLRFTPLAASSLAVASGSEPSVTVRPAPVISISLSLEPVVTVQRDREAPVNLPGYLLPADAPEESPHGGH